jgi:hypothetical protein
MPKVASHLPPTATAGQLAHVLGVTERVVRGRKGDGRLPTAPEGGIDLHEIIRAGVAALAADRTGAGFDGARTRLLTEQADTQAMRNARMRGELLPANEVEMVIGAVVDAQRAGLLSLPGRAAAVLAGETDPARVNTILTEMVRQILAELAETTFEPIAGRLVQRPLRVSNGHGHG